MYDSKFVVSSDVITFSPHGGTIYGGQGRLQGGSHLECVERNFEELPGSKRRRSFN